MRDFIPEGEDTDAAGHGFRDFVPEPVPEAPKEEPKPAPTKPATSNKKK